MKNVLEFDDKDNLIVLRDERRHAYIPAKQVQIIRDNYAKGCDYSTASPMYPITREQFAFIITHPFRVCA